MANTTSDERVVKPVRIAFLSVYDSKAETAWSGTGHYMPMSLEQAGADVLRIGHLRTPLEMACGLRAKAHNRLHSSAHAHTLEWRVSGSLARCAAARLRGFHVDAVLAPDMVPIARLQVDVPIVLWNDATFANMVNFYPDFQNLDAASVRNGHLITAAALKRCSLAIYSSAWAAASAVSDYGLNPDKVLEVPFGANLTHTPSREYAVEMAQAKSTQSCRLLFIGTEWSRKGGDTALEVTRLLNAAGLPTTLTVVGGHPERGAHLPDTVSLLGHIDKATPEGARQISHELSSAHFLLAPSRADCTPIVFSEANAFGVPCLTTRVGGIPSIIREGRNGFLFERDASPEVYVNRIVTTLREREAYLQLSDTSWLEYSTRLNWRVSGQTVLGALGELL